MVAWAAPRQQAGAARCRPARMLLLKRGGGQGPTTGLDAAATVCFRAQVSTLIPNPKVAPVSRRHVRHARWRCVQWGSLSSVLGRQRCVCVRAAHPLPVRLMQADAGAGKGLLRAHLVAWQVPQREGGPLRLCMQPVVPASKDAGRATEEC